MDRGWISVHAGFWGEPPLLFLCCRVAAGRVHSGRVWAAGRLAGGADALLPLPFLLQGVPFPQNEANAMDVVVQFAVHRLGFQPQDIILYAWSIGGFTGTSLPPSHTVRSFSSPSPRGVARSGVGLKEGEGLWAGLEEGILCTYTSHSFHTDTPCSQVDLGTGLGRSGWRSFLWVVSSALSSSAPSSRQCPRGM